MTRWSVTKRHNGNKEKEAYISEKFGQIKTEMESRRQKDKSSWLLLHDKILPEVVRYGEPSKKAKK